MPPPGRISGHEAGFGGNQETSGGIVVNNDRFALLEGLLGEAFARLGQATPTVVSVKPPEEGDETSASYAMPFSWPNRIVASPDDIGPAVSDQLAAGPVLLVPPWNRRQERRHPLSRDEHEIAVLNCVPDGPDSLLAVLTPTGMWSSPSSQQVREELAKRWKPVLLIYAAGVLPGVHSSFLLAVMFLRPRGGRRLPAPRLPGAFRARTTQRSQGISGVCSGKEEAARSSAISCATCRSRAIPCRSNVTILLWRREEQNSRSWEAPPPSASCSTSRPTGSMLHRIASCCRELQPRTLLG